MTSTPRRFLVDDPKCDVLARAVHASTKQDPSSERLLAMQSELHAAFASPAAPASSSPLGAAASHKIWIGGGVVLAAVGLFFAMRDGSAPETVPSSKPVVQVTVSPVTSPSAAPVPSAPLVIEPKPTPRIATKSLPKSVVEAPKTTLTELELLSRAEAELRTSPANALELTDEHLRFYQTGLLAQEREVLAVSALLKLERTEEARARAAQFVAAYPRSPLIRRLTRLLERASQVGNGDSHATSTEQEVNP